MQTTASQQATSPGPENLLDTAAAAAFLGCTASTLNTWRCTRKCKIPFVKIGSLVRYRRRDLEAFLANNVRGA